MLSQAAEKTNAFPIKSKGYCFEFALRKFIIGEARRLYGPELPASSRGNAVDWTKTSIEEIRSVVADSGEHLTIFRSDVVASAASHCIFQRDDWGMMFSCFACLWNEVKVKVVDEGVMNLNDLLDELRDEGFRQYVSQWTIEHGIVPAPFTATQGYLEKIGAWRVKPVRKIRRQRTR